MKVILFLYVFFLGKTAIADFYQPKEGFVPNEKVAIKIAEAVLVPIYGKNVLKERPWHVADSSTKWQIDGTFPKSHDGIVAGGTVHIEINKADGTISNVTHGK